MRPADLKYANDEREALMKLRHPNIICFRDSYESPDRYINIIMEYARGGNLGDQIKARRGRHFPEDLVIRWGGQLCSAIDHAHSIKIMHRDIKPDVTFFFPFFSLFFLTHFFLFRTFSWMRTKMSNWVTLESSKLKGLFNKVFF